MTDSPTYRVSEAARLAQVSVRTLHHYHALGLLVPSGRSRAGYRLYTPADLRRLHRILLCRQLGFPLEDIRQLLDDTGLDLAAALRAQRDRLAAETARTQAALRAVDRALATLAGGETNDNREVTTMFEGFDSFDHEPYMAEAEERWGHTPAYQESARRTQHYGKEQWARIREEGEAVMAAMAALMEAGATPGDAAALEVAERHRRHIDGWFYPCPRAMHASLADLYDGDARFAATFDRHGVGTAKFFAAAVRANAAQSD